jgi:uncharacterized membrane protein
MDNKIANSLVIAGAIGAALLALQQNTELFSAKQVIARERCYGVARAGNNDCGNGKHSCAKRAMFDRQSDEWKMVPAGTCVKLGGSLMSSDKAQL